MVAERGVDGSRSRGFESMEKVGDWCSCVVCLRGRAGRVVIEGSSRSLSCPASSCLDRPRRRTHTRLPHLFLFTHSTARPTHNQRNESPLLLLRHPPQSISERTRQQPPLLQCLARAPSPTPRNTGHQRAPRARAARRAGGLRVAPRRGQESRQEARQRAARGKRTESERAQGASL